MRYEATQQKDGTFICTILEGDAFIAYLHLGNDFRIDRCCAGTVWHNDICEEYIGCAETQEKADELIDLFIARNQ